MARSMKTPVGDMRRLVLMGILGMFGAACTQDLSTVSYVVDEPDPPTAVYELSVGIAGVPSSAVVTSGTEPLEFPQRGGGWGFDGEQDVSIQLCAVARGAGEDETFVALSDPVMVISGRNVEVPLALEPAEDGEIPSECDERSDAAAALQGAAL